MILSAQPQCHAMTMRLSCDERLEGLKRCEENTLEALSNVDYEMACLSADSQQRPRPEAAGCEFGQQRVIRIILNIPEAGMDVKWQKLISASAFIPLG
jgi:hypothetical protein